MKVICANGVQTNGLTAQKLAHVLGPALIKKPRVPSDPNLLRMAPSAALPSPIHRESADAALALQTLMEHYVDLFPPPRTVHTDRVLLQPPPLLASHTPNVMAIHDVISGPVAHKARPDPMARASHSVDARQSPYSSSGVANNANMPRRRLNNVLTSMRPAGMPCVCILKTMYHKCGCDDDVRV